MYCRSMILQFTELSVGFKIMTWRLLRYQCVCTCASLAKVRMLGAKMLQFRVQCGHGRILSSLPRRVSILIPVKILFDFHSFIFGCSRTLSNSEEKF